MRVYVYTRRERALQHRDGVLVKTKRVRVSTGSLFEPVVRCRLVAQEFGYGERLDELSAGAPSMNTVRLTLLHSEWYMQDVMVIDLKSPFLYWLIQRRVHIGLPSQHPMKGERG